MGDHARGDCKKVICSSEEDDLQQEAFRNSSRIPPRAVLMMSQLNLRDKRIGVPGTFGEAPALPTPPTSDDTDRQFWAEDELSSSESRLHLVTKQRRRRSLAHRNRAAIRKRSRSLLCQTSSSNSDPAQHLKISSPIRKNARRRLRCDLGPGASASKKSRGRNNVPVPRASTPRPAQVSNIRNPSTFGGSIQSGIHHVLNSRRQIIQATHLMPGMRQRSRRRRSQTPDLPPSCNMMATMNESTDTDKCKNR